MIKKASPITDATTSIGYCQAKIDRQKVIITLVEVRKETLDKTTVENLEKKIKGEVRGIAFRDDATYIKAKKGEAALKKIEEELEKAGCPIEYDKVKSLKFYPLFWRVTSLLAMKKVFGWGDEEFRQLGNFGSGNSLIIRIYAKFFHSIEKVVSVAPRIYSEYFTKGEAAVPDYSVEKKYAIVEVRGLDLHPIFCRVVEGYLETFVKLVVETQKIKCRETKCTFGGDDCHQYTITWE